ncbi:MAG TPA: amino acid adenylation domain-containing protein [Thermoanaerobaculia bacterium]|nr:amino acid adenylation domain-containing protein [Thermoanaerobaculia bacterium]
MVDRYLQPAPVGVPGELCIGGAGLARGYLGRPDLTAERFLADPFASAGATGGARLYRTGDLARRRADGGIDFLGRIDNQVKVRGFRIELGEIEAALARHPAVRQAVVLAEPAPQDAGGERRLAAYVVRAAAEEEPVSAADFIAALRATLPDYMVPSLWVFLDALPLTPNGKVDRRALAQIDPEAQGPTAGADAAPRTMVEELLVGLLADTLGRERVGVHDNFFELGGHSLLGTRLMARLRDALGVELPLRSLFEAPTAAELASRVESVRDLGRAPLRRFPREGEIPLSFGQERLWFIHQLDPEGAAYNMPAALRMTGRLDRAVFARCFAEIVRRHEVLRTAFGSQDGRPLQVITPPEATPDLQIPLLDLAGIANDRRDLEVRRLAVEEARRPFDLTRAPLLRVQLLRTAEREHVCLFTMHHIVSDGWSLEVLAQEVAMLYSAFALGRPSPLPEPPVQYADFAIWQREWLQGEILERQLAYWREELAGSPTVIELPTDRPRPRVRTLLGANVPVALPGPLLEGLKTTGRGEDVTLFMMILAAWQTLLHRYTGQEDVLVGSVVANRGVTEIEGLIGLFVNILVLRGRLSAGSTFREMLGRERETALGAYAHEDLPFERLVEELRVERSLSHSPIFQVAFAMQNAPEEALDLPGLSLAPLVFGVTTAKFDLTLFLGEAAGALVGTLEYSTDLFDAATLQRMVGHYRVLLEGVIADPGRRLWDLPLLTAAELAELAAWDSTEVPFPGERHVLALFEAQAVRAPRALAIAAGEVQLTYGELDRRAELLAVELRALGVGPEVVVALLTERSPEMAVAVLGILKAGGAYLPLDPAYPPERLAYMLEDSGAAALVVRRDLLPALPATALPVLANDASAVLSEISKAPAAAVPRGAADPGHLAYVIYTSGSTGRPKGVEISHAGLSNLVAWHQRTYGVTAEDRATVLAGPAFDASVWELWPYLTAGASLHVPDADTRSSPERLLGWLAEEGITLSFLPTPLAEALVERVERGGLPRLALRALLTGGDRLRRAPRRELPFRLHNHYGPTESTVVSTAIPVPVGAEPAALALTLQPPPSIGRPIANLQVHLLDRSLGRAPVGVPGELAVGGAGLARGYRRRPDLTAERFVPDPWGAPGSRLYRTGDLARHLAAGDLEFLGRIDHQVKIRGFRIEIGEIESTLTQLPAVAEAVVLLQEHAPDDKRLAAYVVPDAEQAVAARRMLRLEQEGLSRRALHELPNGMPVFHLNRNETEFVFEEIFVHRSYLRHGITIEPGACIFDVGANIGLFTLFMAGLQADVRLFCFEPIPETFAALSGNVGLYGVGARLFDCGLASEERSVEFTSYPNVSLISGFLGNLEEEREVVRAFLQSEHAPLTAAQVEELLEASLAARHVVRPLRRLSDVMRENGVERIDLLKIDVEKAELEVLGGLDEADWPKVQQLVLEVHDVEGRLEQVESLLTRHGFRFAVEQDDALQRTGLYNLYATRAGAAATSEPTAGEAARREAAPAADLAHEPPLAWRSAAQLVAAAKDFARQRLPEYMVPASWVLLEAIPLSPNGKVDRRALAAIETQPSGHDPAASDFVAPRTPTEALLAEMWVELLGVERVGASDNFFDLGGHSLLGTRLTSRLRDAFAVELPLRSLFEAPTVAALAVRVEAARQQAGLAAPPIVRADPHERGERLCLSFAQERLWFLDRLEPGGSLYNIPAALRATGALDVAALALALQEIAGRHETLRTTFSQREGEPYQAIAPSARLDLPIVDLSGLPPGSREAVAESWVRAEAARPFDLARGPLARALALCLSPEAKGDWVVLLTMHHIVSDGWSMGVLIAEVAALYGALLEGRPSPLPELPVQYADFARWQRAWLSGEVLQEQIDYWKGALAGAPQVLELPTDRPRPPVQSFRGAHRPFSLSPAESEAVRTLSRRQGATLFMTLFGGFAALLHRYTGDEDMLVGSPIANRNRSEIEGLIGFFVNTLVMRGRLEGDPSWCELLARVRGTALEAYAHQDLPFERLVEELQVERSLARNPLFQVVFTLQEAAPSAPALPGLTLRALPLDSDTAKTDLLLTVTDAVAGLAGDWEFRTDLFDGATVDRMSGHLRTLLSAAAADSERRLSELPLLTAAERAQLLDWNDTGRLAPPELCLHQRFAARAAGAPEAVALTFEGRSLTYGELDRCADRLAWRLVSLGVGPERLVGIHLERGLERIVAVLAVWKAGGAYLPLDPSYPQERLAFMLEDSGAPVLLTQESLVAALPPHGARVLCLDGAADAAPAADLSSVRSASPAEAATLDHLAYVIYTSGSTGRPNGVLVSHRSVAQLIARAVEDFGVDAQCRVLQLVSFSFDASLLETWMALTSGATLCIARRETRLSGAALAETIRRAEITTAVLTPAILGALADEEIPPTLRAVSVGGESCPGEIATRWAPPQSRLRLLNCYGPTEATIYAAVLRCSGVYRKEPPIGRPVSNSRIHLLDPLGRPVPVGVPGELWIAGGGLARGYLNRPSLTAERFAPDPFTGEEEAGSRLYRTGDLARYLPGGAIEFLGRVDRQVKVRGLRIELGEIEVALAAHPAIRECAVLAREEAGGDRRLVAYSVLRAPVAAGSADAASSGITGQSLREFLRGVLPDYMVPASFVFLPALPLTPTGKVDRRALARERGPDMERQRVEPRDVLELELARIWQEVLEVPRVGVRDNFFELGGHSLLAVRLLAQVERRFGRDLPLATLFQNGTVEEMAGLLRRQTSGERHSSLVPIRSDGAERPFFCVHPAGGDVLCFAALARHLGPDQPFYGLQSRGLSNGEEPLSHVEEMAALYVEEMRRVQPAGPYSLGGWSLGGLIAFEMAQQLRAAGQEVAFLTILDSPAGVPQAEESEVDVLMDIVGYVEALWGKELAISPADLEALEPEARLALIAQRLQAADFLPPGAGPAQLRRILKVYQANMQAARRYVPRHYPDRVTVFKAVAPVAPGEVGAAPALFEATRDADLGWGRVSERPADVYEIPGTHLTAMAEPNVRLLAQRLRLCLEGARAEVEKAV